MTVRNLSMQTVAQGLRDPGYKLKIQVSEFHLLVMPDRDPWETGLSD